MPLDDDERCPQCNGYGLVSDMNYDGTEITYECDMCEGKGYLDE